MFTTIASAAVQILRIANAVLELFTAERLKQQGITETQLEQLQKLQELRDATDMARKNPPADDNLFDSL